VPRRTQRRIWQAAAVASVLSGVPSTTWTVFRSSPGEALSSGVEATRAIGSLVPPGRPGLWRGGVVHGVISLVVGEALGATLPSRRSVAWGTLAGLVIGWVNLSVLARRFSPRLAALPLGPQLADNAAFGAVFAAVADR
jgi:hypothetical protein